MQSDSRDSITGPGIHELLVQCFESIADLPDASPSAQTFLAQAINAQAARNARNTPIITGPAARRCKERGTEE